MGGAVPALCLTTTAATPYGCVLHGQSIGKGAGHSVRPFRVSGVRGSPGPSPGSSRDGA